MELPSLWAPRGGPSQASAQLVPDTVCFVKRAGKALYIDNTSVRQELIMLLGCFEKTLPGQPRIELTSAVCVTTVGRSSITPIENL